MIISFQVSVSNSKNSFAVYEQRNAINNNFTVRYFIDATKYNKLKKFHLHENNIIMSGAGTIGRLAKVPHNFKQGVFNQALIRFIVSNDINVDYFLSFMITPNMQRRLTEANPGSAMVNLVPMKELKKWTVYVPKFNEQEAISKIVMKITNLLSLQQRKLELLKQLKKGILQKMFADKNSKQPVLRFKGFHDDWEQRKLKEMLQERNERITANDEYPLMSFVQGVGVAPKSQRYNREFLVKSSNKKYKKTELGDFIYSSNNLETGSIGFNKTGKAVISPVYSIFKSKNNKESQFIGILSKQKRFVNKMLRYRQGLVYGQWKIHESDFLNLQILAPNIQEQEKIIGLFSKLNFLISLQQQKLARYQSVKKSLLQQMFI